MTRLVQLFAGRVILGILLFAFSLPARAAQFTIDQLMGALANTKHRAATFTEKKYIAILDQPVESSGELLFVPPARLEKRTLKPQLETLVLDGDLLTVEHRLHKQLLRLKDYPEVAGMIESIRATLAGDRAALEGVYYLSLEGGRDRWTLVLTPLHTHMGSVITRIRMEGTRGEVRKVEILQADGDRSVMSIWNGAAP